MGELQHHEIRFDGGASDVQRFAESVLSEAHWDAPCPGEQRVSWATPDHQGSASSLQLRSGLLMTTTAARIGAPFAMTVDHAPSELEFCISQGTGGMKGRCESGEGATFFEPGQLQVAQIKRRSRFVCEAQPGAEDRSVHIQVSVQQLRELLGTEHLPEEISRVVDDPGPYACGVTAMNARLFDVLGEILECQARGATRQLYMEGKGLELVALAVERFSEAGRSKPSELSAQEIERLYRARSLLLRGLESPPALAELARYAGMNERKLKMGFKSLFGTPVYTYLRSQRMERARALLAEGRYNVSEVAQMVGYANPSKFSSAFRRQFGVNPGRVA